MSGLIQTSVLARGVLLGLGAAVPIGPVNVQIARRALREGFFAGAALGCGAVTIDVVYAILSTLSFTTLLTQPLVQRVIGVGGVALLAYLGVMSFRAAWRAMRVDPISPAAASPAPAPGRPALHSA